MAGELKLVASSDIGELGPKEAEPVVFNWKWYYNAPTAILWLILLATLVLIKDNRNPQAWLILVPVVIVTLLASLLIRLLPRGFEIVTVIIQTFCVGIAVIWLLAHKLGNRNRLATFLLSLIIMAIIAIAGESQITSNFSLKSSTVTIVFMLTLTLLLGMTMSGVMCRKRYNGVRFMLWLLLWSIVSAAIIMFVFMAIMLFSISASLDNIRMILMQVPIGGLAYGLFVYLINLPFMILVLRSGFYRKRFYGCFHLVSMTTPVTPTAETVSQ